MDLEAVRAFNLAVGHFDEVGRAAALERLGNPSAEEIVDQAFEGLEDPDRNVRVQMLRLALAQPVARASKCILRGLRDPARRVRRLAARDGSLHAGNPEVEARLREIVEDENETTRIRGAAFGSLSRGRFLAKLSSAPEEARAYFDDVPGLRKYRRAALHALVSLDPLGEAGRELLQRIAEIGDKAEAVMATRALCGFKAVNLGAFPDPAERRRIARTHDLAWGEVFYWVPRSDAAH